MTLSLSPRPTLLNLSILTPYQEGRYQWRACMEPGCNRVYKAATNGTDDARCEEHRKETLHGKHVRTGPKHYADYAPVVLEHDPLPRSEGGFPKGAEFDLIHFCRMLQDGTIGDGAIMTWRGERYTKTGHNEITDSTGKRYYAVNQKLKERR